MKTNRQTKVRSIVVLIVAALLLELTTAIQYYSTRRAITTQVTEMAQRDLRATSHTAQLKQEVEKSIAGMMPDIECHIGKATKDSIRILITDMLSKQNLYVGVDFCYVVSVNGVRNGLYIYKDEGNKKIVEQKIDFDYTQRSWYSQALSGNGFWSEPYLSKYYVDLMCTYSQPVRDAKGNTIAVLGADVPMREVSALATGLYKSLQSSLIPLILMHILGLFALAFIIQRSIKSIRHLQTVRDEKNRIEDELNIARGIQQTMLPKTFPPYPDRDDIDVFAMLTPAREVGGDFYDFLIRDEKLFFCIGDVSGKGVPAALLMAVASSTFRTLSSRESLPNDIMTAMNETLAKENEYNMFITLFIGVLDIPSGMLKYCNAGHKAPILVKTNGQQELEIDANLPVGVFSDFQYTMQEVAIEPQTTVFMYTDGLTEAEDANKKLFGIERIFDTIKDKQPRVLINDMDSAVHAFVGDTEQSDDLTMLALHYLGGNKRAKQNTLESNLSITLTNDVGQTPKIAEFVNKIADDLKLTSSVSMQINLALEEAVVNVMEYAYPNGVEGTVTVDATVKNGELYLKIYDNGEPFDPTTREDADITLPAEQRKEGGLGIHIMRRFLDGIDYERNDKFNILTLRKKIH